MPCVSQISHGVSGLPGRSLYCTVTCRQFYNLTFAPRKTCDLSPQQPHASTLSMSQQLLVYKKAREKSRFFFIFFDLSVFMQKEKYRGAVLCTFPIFLSFLTFSNYSEPHLDSAALHLDVASRHMKFQKKVLIHASMIRNLF